MADSGHGLQIVDVKEHKHILHEEDLKSLLMREDVKDLPVVVVSVAGAARGGKSFLLNFFVRYLASTPSAQKDGSWLSDNSEPLAGFQWRSGIDPTTMGILMWSTPFISTLPSGVKVAILLVDTQGTFDSRSTVRDNSTIFALSTLVSSIQIYNLSHDIMEDDLQHLELFTEYSKLVNSGGSNSKAFQVLEFLVRDWQFPDEYPYGTAGGDRLLQKKLEITEDLAKEMKELRQHIWSSFDKVSCFLMPHPGFKVLKKTFNGSIKDIDLDFKMQLIDLTNSIFGPEKLLPKTLNGEFVKARDLVNYFKSYMELLNSDKIPSPTSFLAATVKAGLLSAVSKSREIYERGMELEVGTNQPSVPVADLEFLHKKYVAAASDAFNKKKKMGSAKEAAEYLDKLSEELAYRLPQFLQSNLSKIQTAMNKAKESYEDAIQNISKEQPLCVHPKDLERIHNEGVSAAIRTYDAAWRRVTEKNDDERAKFIQSFEKQYALLRRSNEQNNNTAVTALGMEYWKRMMTKANQKPPLSDAAFREEHDAAVVQALKDFDSKRNIPNQYSEDVFKFNLTKLCQENFIGVKELNKSSNREALQAAIEEYDNYMKNFSNFESKCMHPDDLEEEFRLALCRAMTTFRPSKICSEGINVKDDDEVLLDKIIRKRYQTTKQNNDAANETAVLMAYNEYVSTIDELCRFSMWWLLLLPVCAECLIVPVAANLLNRNDNNKESKKKGLEKFDTQRRAGRFHSSDPYKDRLERIMQEYYTQHY